MLTPHNTESKVENLESKVFHFISFVAGTVCQVKTHDECLKSIGIPQLRGKVLRGVGIWHSAHAHAVKMSGGRIKILNKDGLVAREQALAQALGVTAIGKRPYLHGEISNRGTRAGKQLDAHRRRACSDHVESDCRRPCKIQHSFPDEGAAVDDANFNLAAVVQVGDAQDAPKRECAVSRNQSVHVEDFTVGGAASVKRHTVP
jgi:hypothetical protein